MEMIRETLYEEEDGSAHYDRTFRRGIHGAAFRVRLMRRERDGKFCAVIRAPGHVMDVSKLTRTPHGYTSSVVPPAFDSREEALLHAEREIRTLLGRLLEFSPDS
ncbi:MAG: hypothetical protein NVSMB52_10050 [Chloroflexota bacterium]